MIASPAHRLPLPRATGLAALLALGMALSGCAEMGDGVASAFADPAKYDLWDCKQLEGERKNLATRTEQLRNLMAKAQAGVAGPVVSELAYRNEYLAVRGQARLADEVWQRNKCHASAPAAAAPATASAPPANPKEAPPPSRSGSAVY